ncbi:MAG TPA: SH3 domain-containing C40 family peptidase [Gemmatimonadaceae bacterium]|nr:SH3 domain-containing C40 family peptidase [Gemmatimonadaceae bacterium]
MSGRWVVRVSVAPVNAEARAVSEQVSQALFGHPVEPLDAGEREPWHRVRLHDGYEGWMHRGYLSESDRSHSPNGAGPSRVSLGCVVREAAGARLALPLGAWLHDALAVESGEAIDGAAIARRFPPRAPAAAATACARFEGTPYEWGGLTPWGADCSGLVQTVFGLHGIALPRDARDQAEQGEPVAAGDALGGLAAGDLAFFSDRDDGPITHVAIALGGSRLVHLGLGRGGYAVENLAAPDAYARALLSRFRWARRVG